MAVGCSSRRCGQGAACVQGAWGFGSIGPGHVAAKATWPAAGAPRELPAALERLGVFAVLAACVINKLLLLLRFSVRFFSSVALCRCRTRASGG